MEKQFFSRDTVPAGGCLILFPLMFELSNFSNFIDLRIITPYFMVLVSILLISKIPTFSFKKLP